jgi:hypothetical protein
MVIDMRLQDLKKEYDVVVSIGSSCLPAYQIQRHRLRAFSGPLDWVLSPKLSDVNRLLQNKFAGFMELPSMKLVDGAYYSLLNEYSEPQNARHTPTYRVEDTCYGITSVHDFPVIPGNNWSLSYPVYKDKLNRRIVRFLEQITQRQTILLVRMEATYEEAAALRGILPQLTASRVDILIVNPVVDSASVSEKEWGIPGVCMVESPAPYDIWHGEDAVWDEILSGIRLTTDN